MVSARRATASLATYGGWSALAAAALLLAACGGGRPAASAPASVLLVPAAPGASSASPGASGTSAAAGHVQFPGELIGLQRDTSAGGQAASTLNQEVGTPMSDVLVNSQSAIYGKEPSFFYIMAGGLPASVTAQAVAQSLKQSWSSQGVADVQEFSEGSGVYVVCGHMQNKDDECAWADGVSFGYVLYPPGFASSVSDAASKTSQVHSGVVH